MTRGGLPPRIVQEAAGTELVNDRFTDMMSSSSTSFSSSLPVDNTFPLGPLGGSLAVSNRPTFASVSHNVNFRETARPVPSTLLDLMIASALAERQRVDRLVVLELLKRAVIDAYNPFAAASQSRSSYHLPPLLNDATAPNELAGITPATSMSSSTATVVTVKERPHKKRKHANIGVHPGLDTTMPTCRDGTQSLPSMPTRPSKASTIEIVPCRARAMPLDHNFHVRDRAGIGLCCM
jgi:hypothetical protein